MQWDRKWLLRKINFQTFFFFVFSFNWGVIALQYCVGFYHISTWVSRRYTYVPCLVNLPPTSHPILPLWVVIEHGFELPASDSKFPLAVCFTYDNVDMSVLFSILFPPSPCPSPWPRLGVGGKEEVPLSFFFFFFLHIFPYPQYLPKERRASKEQTKWCGSVRHHFVALPLGSKD